MKRTIGKLSLALGVVAALGMGACLPDGGGGSGDGGGDTSNNSGGGGGGGGGGDTSNNSGGGGGGGGGGSNLKQTGEGPCEEAGECAGDVCVSLIDGDNPPIYCTEPCDGGCPDGFFCDSQTFGLVGLSFCRYTTGQPDEEDSPPPPEEPPKLPCKADADCDEGLVCATFMGERECTIPCNIEEDCTFQVGPITADFATCGADQTSGADRNVCLPDPDCYTGDPTACFGGFPGF